MIIVTAVKVYVPYFQNFENSSDSYWKISLHECILETKMRHFDDDKKGQIY